MNGALETAHVKNTGRCKELLLPGVTVILEVSDNPARKNKYDLIAVYKEGLGLINMDSQDPNKATHPEFAVALEEAKATGVKIYYLCCEIKEDELKIAGYSVE